MKHPSYATAMLTLALLSAGIVACAGTRDTFGTSYKANGPGPGGSWTPGTELLVFTHNCSDSVFGCAMNYFWAGGAWTGYYDSRILYYVDNEEQASVNLPFGLAHGSNMIDDDAPWSAGSLFGKTGQPSGIFNTFQIPFTESIKVTVILSPGGNRFWLNLRGHSGIPLRIGSEELNEGATGVYRLKSYENRNIMVPKDARISIVNSYANEGAVYMTMLSVYGFSSSVFLEGCYRAEDPATNTVRYLMSSGTEDYFLGTYYFNRGKYTNPLAGLTNKNVSGPVKSFSAYHVHEDDQIWFQNGLRMTWLVLDLPAAPAPTILSHD